MFTDIVFPRGNEDDFIRTAQRLGHGGLCFVYDSLKDYNLKKDIALKKNISVKKEINAKKDISSRKEIRIFTGVLADFSSIEKYRAKADIILMDENSDSRRAVEKARPDIIFGLEKSHRQDFLHQRNSGLNHILCRFAHENEVAVGFCAGMLLDRRNRSRLMGRLSQNIRLCRKYKTRAVIASFADDPYSMRSSNDLQKLFITLGMHPKEAKEALDGAEELIQRKTSGMGTCGFRELI